MGISCLRWIEDGEVKEFDLDLQKHLMTEPATLGRENEVDLQFLDDDVSRVHANFYFRGHDWYVQDESTYGTTVQRGEVTSRIDGKTMKLRDGDLIEIGTRQIRYVSSVAQEGTPTKAPGVAVMRLTDRDLSVLGELGRDYRRQPGVIPTNSKIAEALNISLSNVGKYLGRLYVKFGIGDEIENENKRVVLVELAIKLRYI